MLRASQARNNNKCSLGIVIMEVKERAVGERKAEEAEEEEDEEEEKMIRSKDAGK